MGFGPTADRKPSRLGEQDRLPERARPVTAGHRIIAGPGSTYGSPTSQKRCGTHSPTIREVVASICWIRIAGIPEFAPGVSGGLACCPSGVALAQRLPARRFRRPGWHDPGHRRGVNSPARRALLDPPCDEGIVKVNSGGDEAIAASTISRPKSRSLLPGGRGSEWRPTRSTSKCATISK